MKNRVSRDWREPPGPEKQPGSIEIGPGGWGACFEAVFPGLTGRRRGPKNRVFQKSPRTSSPCSPWPGEPPGRLPVPSWGPWGPIGPMGGAPPHGALGAPIGPMYVRCGSAEGMLHLSPVCKTSLGLTQWQGVQSAPCDLYPGL